MSLIEYRLKRNFRATREPKPETCKDFGQRFVIQKHNASRLHYDFRLEMKNNETGDVTLKSWAIPKEPMMDPKVRRLAIQVDDHELSYADFEGEIPKGQYGAGTVKTWDKGEYDLIDRKDYKYIINLHGKKLKGEFVLVQMTGKEWLLFKKKE